MDLNHWNSNTGLTQPHWTRPKSLCSSLDRLLAWEKKLYEEVKAREGFKIEHKKKLAKLQSQAYKGENEAKLNKTKGSVTRLQSLIVVTSQAVSTTSTAFVCLRDTDLLPQLVELCHGGWNYGESKQGRMGPISIVFSFNLLVIISVKKIWNSRDIWFDQSSVWKTYA